MISKMEAIQKLKKMGLQLADDDSVVTVLVPKDRSLYSGLKEIREKLKEIDYHASFCVKYETEDRRTGNEEPSMEAKPEDFDDMISMDEDGQLSLNDFF